jgi:hypothetical protein
LSWTVDNLASVDSRKEWLHWSEPGQVSVCSCGFCPLDYLTVACVRRCAYVVNNSIRPATDRRQSSLQTRHLRSDCTTRSSTPRSGTEHAHPARPDGTRSRVRGLRGRPGSASAPHRTGSRQPERRTRRARRREMDVGRGRAPDGVRLRLSGRARAAARSRRQKEQNQNGNTKQIISTHISRST